jgi:aspartyl protease
MPILNSQLDHDGHALVTVFLVPAAPRRKALQAAGQAQSPAQPVSGMIDTGATVTVIDTKLRQALSLVPFRLRRAAVPSVATPVRVYSYKVDLYIAYPMGQFFSYPMLSVLEMPLIHTGTEVLVGQDVLSQCHFTHNGPAGTFSLAH